MAHRNLSLKYVLVCCMLFFTNVVSSSLYFSTANILSKENTKQKKKKKRKKQGIKNFLFLYYIKAKCSNIADKNPNAADGDKQTFNYRWPCKYLEVRPFLIIF